MDDSEATSLEQIEAFLAGSGGVRFAGQKRDEVYAWTERTLVRHQYCGLSKREKGLLRTGSLGRADRGRPRRTSKARRPPQKCAQNWSSKTRLTDVLPRSAMLISAASSYQPGAPEFS